MPHAARHRANQCVGKAEELSRYTARVHQVAHEDEEGSCDHGEGVGCLGDTLQHHNRLHAGDKDVEEGRKPQINVQGKPGKQQNQKYNQCSGHSSSPPLSL